MKEVTIYTDGSCLGNPGPGGWAAILMYGDHQKELSGGHPSTTNNRMELTGVLESLKALKFPCKVTLYTDSKYVENAIHLRWLYKWANNGWVTSTGPVKNLDLWEEIYKLLQIHTVKAVWVKGHSGNLYNGRCDELAYSQAQYYQHSVE